VRSDENAPVVQTQNCCSAVSSSGSHWSDDRAYGSSGTAGVLRKTKEKYMTSRTPEGKHTKRFIIEAKSLVTGKWFRSGNPGLENFYTTREDAKTALSNGVQSRDVPYRIRQK
jgi:hypothetical protein